MNKRQRKYMELLEDRCSVLRARIGEGSKRGDDPAYKYNWSQELAAIEWALSMLRSFPVAIRASSTTFIKSSQRGLSSGDPADLSSEFDR